MHRGRIPGTFTVLALIAAAATAQTGTTIPTIKTLQDELAKDPTSVGARRALVDHMYAQRRGPTAPLPPQGVIYGEDDRIDVYAETDPNRAALADSVCVVVSAFEVSDNGDGTYTLSTSAWTSQSGATICADEPFRGQQTIGFCSGFFLGGDIVGTAGHCIDGGDIGNTAFVFGFVQIDENTPPEIVVPADRVYFTTEIIDRALGGGDDHTIVRVDRPITGRAPLALSRDGAPPVGAEIFVIGHPATLPMKIAAGAQIKSIQSGFFQANLDTYGGNSGSAIFNANTLEVEGILVRGAPDYASGPGGCTQSNRVPDTGNTGGGLTFEECSLAETFAAFVPELALSVSPLADAYHIGPVGGPFSPISVTYTLRNPTSETINYDVSLSGAGLLELNPSRVTGAIPPGGEEPVVVALDFSVTSLPAGLYSETVTFTDLTNSETFDRVHEIEVGQSVVSVSPETDFQASGPIGGPFPGQAVYDIQNDRPLATSIAVSSDQPWLLINGGANATINLAAQGAAGDAASLTVDVAPAADALAAGVYTATLTFQNMVSGAVETRAASLDVGRLSYVSTDTPIAIPDNNAAGITSVITIPGAFCVADVDVDVDITHTFRGDLIVELIAPDGTNVRLHNRTGSSADNIVATYDDDGDGVLPDGPGALTDFFGGPASGDWTLRVSDNAGIDVGTLNTWTLRIGVSGDGCPPQAFDIAASGPIHLPIAFELEGLSLEGLPLDFVITSLPANGILWHGAQPVLSTPFTIPGGMMIGPDLTYRPHLNYTGPDGFSYFVEDAVASAPAQVSLQVAGADVAYDFPLDDNPGWSTEGAWAFGVPTGGGSNNGDPTSGATGANVYGYNLNGDYPNNLNTTHYLTTGPIDLSANTGVRVAFQRHLGVERAAYDHANFEISPDDGASWQLVWKNPVASAVSDADWVAVEYDVSAQLDGAANARLRWGMGTTDSSVVYPGWNIDDVQILADMTAPAADMTTEGSTNGIPDGQVTLSDFSYYLARWSAGAPQADITTTGTSNLVSDGVVELSDFSAYLALWSNGQ